MVTRQVVDGVLIQWGDRLFPGANRIKRPDLAPRLDRTPEQHAAVVRQRIAAVVRRSPQAFVKVNRGCKGLRALSSHFAYISRDGRLELEDDRGVRLSGKDGLRDLANQWRYAGALIGSVSDRQEAITIVLSAPSGSDPERLLEAARGFARANLAGHRYVMVLHEDTAHPHVHLTVRELSRTGNRLPAWTDRCGWRRDFADRLCALGIEVDASTQATRGENRAYPPLWQVKARDSGSLHKPGPQPRTDAASMRARTEAMLSWAHVMRALSESELPQDRQLAEHVARFVRETPFFKDLTRQLHMGSTRTREEPQVSPAWDLLRSGPELSR